MGEVTVTPETLTPKKVIYIPKMYGISEPTGLQRSITGISADWLEAEKRKENDIALDFLEAGYIILREGNRKTEFTGRPGEIGIDADKSLSNTHTQAKVIAERAGVIIPAPITSEMLRHGVRFPIVVKDPSEHAGNQVYLLQDEEAFARFETYRRLGAQMEWILDEGLDPSGAVTNLINAARSFSDSPRFVHPFRSYEYEEFIDSPSEYYTSLRVVVDAFGEIYAAKLIRSAKKKGEEMLIQTDISESADPISEFLHRKIDYKDLLEYQRSPLFINSPKIVSNAAEKGIIIPLNGVRVDDEVNSEVLRAHGIDPKNPLLPSSVREVVSRIGIVARGLTPYGGADFVLRQGSLEPVFLEYNVQPFLTPEDVGLQLTPQMRYLDKWELVRASERRIMQRIATK